MNELQEIDVYISPNGTIKVEIRGAKGKKCLRLTKEMEGLLGGQILDRTLTDEYNQEQEQSQTDWLRVEN